MWKGTFQKKLRQTKPNKGTILPVSFGLHVNKIGTGRRQDSEYSGTTIDII